MAHTSDPILRQIGGQLGTGREAHQAPRQAPHRQPDTRARTAPRSSTTDLPCPKVPSVTSVFAVAVGRAPALGPTRTKPPRRYPSLAYSAIVLSGDVLSRWLQHRAGTVVAGSLVRLSPSGLLRVSSVTDSRPVRVMLPVAHGGQAAVSRALPEGHGGPALALRVQAVSSEQEKARQMERLVAMLTVAEAARTSPATYPAVLPVHESFVVAVPGPEIGITGPTAEHELWCDVMAWCPRNLATYRAEAGPAAQEPRTVAARLLPVLTTVQAVHDSLNIVHRDITPYNVLVDEAGRLLLADWGIAHAVAADRTSTHTQMVGNRGFSLPPEMLAGDSAVGRYTDAWYLGSLLVWMLTGQPPDPHGQLPSDLPEGPDGERLVAVAQGLCQPDPHRRMDLSEAAEQLSSTVGPGWVPPAPSVVAENQPRWGTPQTRPPDQTRPEHLGTPVATTPFVTDAAAWSAEVSNAPRSSTRALGAVLTIAVVLVIGLVAGALWLISHDDQDAPTAGAADTPRTSGAPDTSPTAQETSPEPEPTRSEPPPDEPDYPAFTGLDAARAAFALLDDPMCTQDDPATYVPAGAKEVFRCTWSGINATVYLTLWESAAQGAAAWENLDAAALGGVMTMSSGTWSLTEAPGEPRGPSFQISTTAARPSSVTACYRDLPYCRTVEFGDSYEYDKANSRINVLTATEAADLVVSWPS